MLHILNNLRYDKTLFYFGGVCQSVSQLKWCVYVICLSIKNEIFRIYICARTKIFKRKLLAKNHPIWKMRTVVCNIHTNRNYSSLKCTLIIIIFVFSWHTRSTTNDTEPECSTKIIKRTSKRKNEKKKKMKRKKYGAIKM